MGVEVLIRKINNVGNDAGMVWKRGDIVNVQEQGRPWGSKEEPPSNFVIITITDVTLEQAQNWVMRQLEDGEGHVVRLRLRRVIWANLPQGVKDQLMDTGRYTTTWVAIKNFIHNMQTGLPDLPESPE